MKHIWNLLLIIGLLLVSCGGADKSAAEAPQAEEDPIQTALKKTEAAGSYGTMTGKESTTITTILSSPEIFEGKTVTVAGEIVDVCPMKGCWIEVTDEQMQKIRVKVNDGDIVFPLSSVGHQAIVEGVVERIELDEKQAANWLAHEAEEKGETFDPASVTGPMTIWRIKGAGAEIKRL